MTDAVLVERLERTFGATRAVDGVDLAVAPGEIYGFILFFPFAFLTMSFLPKQALTGWLATIAEYNPVTYLLGGMRSLVLEGWDGEAILEGVSAIVGIALVSMTLALRALRGRLRRGS